MNSVSTLLLLICTSLVNDILTSSHDRMSCYPKTINTEVLDDKEPQCYTKPFGEQTDLKIRCCKNDVWIKSRPFDKTKKKVLSIKIYSKIVDMLLNGFKKIIGKRKDKKKDKRIDKKDLLALDKAKECKQIYHRVTTIGKEREYAYYLPTAAYEEIRKKDTEKTPKKPKFGKIFQIVEFEKNDKERCFVVSDKNEDLEYPAKLEEAVITSPYDYYDDRHYEIQYENGKKETMIELKD